MTSNCYFTINIFTSNRSFQFERNKCDTDLLEDKSVSLLALASDINTLYRRQTMSFTKQLFEMTSMALPDVTARTFSRYLGKSEGYYGSVSSQNLNIATNSLLFLSEVLEQKSMMNTNKSIAELQTFIAKEIARRMQTLDTQNMAVRKLVMKSIARAYMSSEHDFSAPPIVIC